MPRLFIRHEPVEAYVAVGLGELSFKVDEDHLKALNIDTSSYSLDVCYVCIVHDGKCYAGREFHRILFAGRYIVTIKCAPFSNNPVGQKMILADMILE